VRAAPWLSVSLLLGACIPSPPRAPRALFSVGEVIVSNSPTRVERHEPIAQAGQLAVDYSLLFENRGSTVLVVMAAQAQAMLAATPAAAACGAHGDPPTARDLSVSPGARLRLDCRLTASDGRALLRSVGDDEMTLVLPVRHLGEQAEPDGPTTLTFKYPLRREDAE
jgi:hypothetical protein